MSTLLNGEILSHLPLLVQVCSRQKYYICGTQQANEQRNQQQRDGCSRFPTMYPDLVPRYLTSEITSTISTQCHRDTAPEKDGRTTTGHDHLSPGLCRVDTYHSEPAVAAAFCLHTITATQDAECTSTSHELIHYFIIGPIPWGHSGPLCHALSLSLSLS